MIDPINLIKLDEIRDDSGKTFHVGELPPYDQLDYDLSSPKDFEKFIKDVKSEVRGSFEYREMVRYLKEHGGMDRSGINPNIVAGDGKVKIEIHHTPMVLEDIVRTVYEKRLFFHEDISLEMVAKEVMEDHYKNMVGLFPLSSTEHELVHSGYIFIPPEKTYGDYKKFIDHYKPFMPEEDIGTLEDIEEYSEKEFNPEEQNKILGQSNIYIDPNGAYDVPRLPELKDKVIARIDTIKNNMYTLPVLDETLQKEEKEPVQGLIFLYGEDYENDKASTRG